MLNVIQKDHYEFLVLHVKTTNMTTAEIAITEMGYYDRGWYLFEKGYVMDDSFQNKYIYVKLYRETNRDP